MKEQCKNNQWNACCISNTDNSVTKRKYILLFTVPIKLLTSELVTPANALTITENSADMLLIIFDAASSVSPKRSIARKNINQMATLVKYCNMLHIETKRLLSVFQIKGKT